MFGRLPFGRAPFDGSAAVSNLFTAIDEEGFVDDTDFVQSPENPTGQIYRFKISDPAVTPAKPFIINYRYSTLSGSPLIKMRLFEGTTLIREWFHDDASTTTKDGSQELTDDEFDAITDFNNLYGEIEAGSDMFIDGTAGGGLMGSGTTLNLTSTLTTTESWTVVFCVCHLFNYGGHPSSVSSPNIIWDEDPIFFQHNGGTANDLSMWRGIAPNPVSGEQITIHTGGSGSASSGFAFAVAGADLVDSVDAVLDTTASGDSTFTPAVGESLVVAPVLTASHTGSPGSGWTLMSGSGNPSNAFLLLEYQKTWQSQSFTSTITGDTVDTSAIFAVKPRKNQREWTDPTDALAYAIYDPTDPANIGGSTPLIVVTDLSPFGHDCTNNSSPGGSTGADYTGDASSFDVNGTPAFSLRDFRVSCLDNQINIGDLSDVPYVVVTAYEDHSIGGGRASSLMLQFGMNFYPHGSAGVTSTNIALQDGAGVHDTGVPHGANGDPSYVYIYCDGTDSYISRNGSAEVKLAGVANDLALFRFGYDDATVNSDLRIDAWVGPAVVLLNPTRKDIALAVAWVKSRIGM